MNNRGRAQRPLPPATVGLLLGLAASSAHSSADVSLYATLTSEYIYRGLAMTDRNPAAQMGLDIGFDDHFFAGAWISTVDLRNPNGGRDFESNLYAGVHRAFGRRLSASVTLLRYTYPGADGQHGYEHNEGLVTISWDARYSVEYAYTADARGLDERATHVLLSADWPLQNGWVLGANLGRHDLTQIRLPAYVHGNVGVSTRLSRFTFDVRLYGNESIEDARLDAQTAGTRAVFSVSAAF